MDVLCKERQNIAVGIITNTNSQILITKRPEHVALGGYWEFPGGKLEAGETARAALEREIREEVNLVIVEAEWIETIPYSYPDKNINLHVFHITQFTGHAICAAGQTDLRWVHADALHNFEFPTANKAIITIAKRYCYTELCE
jgi:8-oxo-dGTP diphosphatase